jgi:nucleotide-binding universal stress UspA family protein
MQIRTVLCPIDFSRLDERELAIALETCRTFGAKLVLHHCLPAAEPGFSRAWEWAKASQDKEPSEAAVVERLRALLDRVAGSVPAEAVVTSGRLVESVLTLVERLPADLMIIGSHGWSTQDHASVTERVIDRARCPVLTFQEWAVAPPFRLRAEPGGPPRRILVPTDLTPASRTAVRYACELGRQLGVHVELLRVVSDDASGGACDRAHGVLAGLVPPDLVGKVSARVRRGEPGTEITSYIEVTAPAFVVLGEHARGFVRRFLTPDTTQAVVRRIHCPAWVIPASSGT